MWGVMGRVREGECEGGEMCMEYRSVMRRGLPVQAFFANAYNTLALCLSGTATAAATIISVVNLPGNTSPRAVGQAR